jgi:pyrimidine-nucleoside phosphorylase
MPPLAEVHIPGARVLFDGFNQREAIIHDPQFEDHLLLRDSVNTEYLVFASPIFTGVEEEELDKTQGELTVYVKNPEGFGGNMPLLEMTGRFDEGGDLIGLAGDSFTAHYYHDGIDYQLSYQIDPEERSIAYLDKVVRVTGEENPLVEPEEEILMNDEINTLGLFEKWIPNRIFWTETFMTYLSGKKFAPGKVPHDFTASDYSSETDLTGDDIREKLLLPVSYTREDLQWYTITENRFKLPLSRVVEFIDKTARGERLKRQEIFGFINGFVAGEIADYQVAAWLMAVKLKGLTFEETVDLTMAMAVSGEVLNLDEFGNVADKHSTGGVGDKTSLVVGPMVAACDVIFGKMSGRGLGFTGGTLDKLEAIPPAPGREIFNVNLTRDEFLQQIREIGIVISGQSHDLAPADGKIYALRDVTATIDSIPLIAASIMSKKIASGANTLVLDVKVGKGAFMKTLPEARELAKTMVEIGKLLGIKVEAEITGMDQPLGYAVGNTLEVEEAIRVLKNEISDFEYSSSDFYNHCVETAARIVAMAKKIDMESARKMVVEKIADGTALRKFREMIIAQGGNPDVIENPSLMRRAIWHSKVYAQGSESGFISDVDALVIGELVKDLGGGRARKGEAIDHGVGVKVRAKVGQMVKPNEMLFEIHARTEAELRQAEERLRKSVKYSQTPVIPPSLLYEVIK